MKTIAALPHPTAQKFDVITVVGIGLVVFIIAGLIFLKLRNRGK